MGTPLSIFCALLALFCLLVFFNRIKKRLPKQAIAALFMTGACMYGATTQSITGL